MSTYGAYFAQSPVFAQEEECGCSEVGAPCTHMLHKGGELDSTPSTCDGCGCKCGTGYKACLQGSNWSCIPQDAVCTDGFSDGDLSCYNRLESDFFACMGHDWQHFWKDPAKLTIVAGGVGLLFLAIALAGGKKKSPFGGGTAPSASARVTIRMPRQPK